MNLTVSVTEFKAKCLKLLDNIHKGELSQIDVSRHGKVIATLVPALPQDAATEMRGYGALRGLAVAKSNYDFAAPILDDEPNADIENLTR